MAKVKFISASVISLNLKPTESAVLFNTSIQAHDLAHQITSKCEAAHNAINLICTLVTRVHKHDFHLSPAPRNKIANTSDSFNSLKYAYPG